MFREDSMLKKIYSLFTTGFRLTARRPQASLSGPERRLRNHAANERVALFETMFADVWHTGASRVVWIGAPVPASGVLPRPARLAYIRATRTALRSEARPLLKAGGLRLSTRARKFRRRGHPSAGTAAREGDRARA